MDGGDPRKKLAYEESIRALGQQSSALDDLRSRTGILLAALALSASFLGARALDVAGFSVWTWIAIVFFGAAGLACLAILWPTGDWRFVSDAETISDDVDRNDYPDMDAMYDFLARSNQEDWKENDVKRLKPIYRYFRLAVLFLILQVAFWLIALGNAHASTEKAQQTSGQTVERPAPQATPEDRRFAGSAQAFAAGNP